MSHYGPLFAGIVMVVVFIALSLLFGSSSEEDKPDEDSLDKYNDGMGNFIAGGEHMSREEAEDAESRGELYDTHN